MGIISLDTAQNADVVGADMQGGALPVGQQPTSERIEQREGRNVVLVVYQVARFMPEGAHVAAGNPTVPGDDQSELVFVSCGVNVLGQERNWFKLAVVDCGICLDLPWKLDLGANYTAMHHCARARART